MNDQDSIPLSKIFQWISENFVFVLVVVISIISSFLKKKKTESSFDNESNLPKSSTVEETPDLEESIKQEILEKIKQRTQPKHANVAPMSREVPLAPAPAIFNYVQELENQEHILEESRKKLALLSSPFPLKNKPPSIRSKRIFVSARELRTAIIYSEILKPLDYQKWN